MARVLIAGCGDLGSGLATLLVEQGHDVTGIRRTGHSFPDGVKGITGNLVGMKAELLPDVDLAFLIMTPQGRSEEAYRAAYFDTAQVLVRRYRSMTKPPKVFFVSSTSVYGQNQGEWIDEHTLAEPNSATAKVLLETEQVLAKCFPCVSLRCSGIYGAGRYGMLNKVRSGECWEANSWTNRVHRDDVVEASFYLACKALAGDELREHYLLTDDTPASMWEVKLCIANLLSTDIHLPDNVQAFIPRSGKRISNRALREAGFHFRYPSYFCGYASLVSPF